jgi:hypothetical protein
MYQVALESRGQVSKTINLSTDQVIYMRGGEF